jgi:hypothetical protein
MRDGKAFNSQPRISATDNSANGQHHNIDEQMFFVLIVDAEVRDIMEPLNQVLQSRRRFGSGPIVGV